MHRIGFEILIPSGSSSLSSAPIPLWANDQDRTGDLILTMDVLYQLSYIGLFEFKVICPIIERHSEFKPNHSLFTLFKSGRRGSNPPPSAWKADALPNELLPLVRNWISAFTNWRFSLRMQPNFSANLLKVFWWGEEDSNLRSSRNGFTVRPIWPLWYLPFSRVY